MSKDTLQDIIGLMTMCIELGGRDAALGKPNTNPHKGASLSGMCWQYGYDNRVMFADLKSAMGEWIRGNSFTVPEPKPKCYPFYQCSSVSLIGERCGMAMDHTGPHQSTKRVGGTDKQPLYSMTTWTTEMQSADSWPKFSEEYFRVIRDQGPLSWKQQYQCIPEKWEDARQNLCKESFEVNGSTVRCYMAHGHGGAHLGYAHPFPAPFKWV